MMKRITVIWVACLLSLSAFAQQLPQFSQYVMNQYAINPAVAGSHDALEIKSTNRYQWTGIKDAPRTYTLSLTNPLADGTMGVGAYIFTDIVGPTRRIGIQASYAYHFQVTDDMKIGAALSGGILEYTIDGDKISLTDSNDPALINTLGRTTVFDAKAGIYAYTDKFYLGFSIPQIVQNNLQLHDGIETFSRIESHYFFYAGYKYDVTDEIMLEPSLLIKTVVPTPTRFDMTLRGHYQEKFWLGASYRLDDAMVAMMGYTWEDRILFGYSYDLTLSDLQGYSGGSHELMLGLKLGKLK
jgi:type IX secretion system PorP/SprF family membrane protein